MSQQCELLDLSRSSFYYVPATEAAQNLAQMALRDKEYTDHSFRGSQGMTALLRREDEAIKSKSRRSAVPAIFGEGNVREPTKTFGHLLLAVYSRFCVWDGTEKKAAMNTQTGAQGGYVVPTVFYNRPMMLATERRLTHS